ncbi:fatty-acid--CoA ligase [Microbacterium testaceum]|uniref:Fatty-acid--CoA ligase n=1 Tax=Microbacterium testaceum TaxID=2033 RepID=A0A147EXZ1_MICTE|nr:AMP-binding protein [Microbacterium testaceum]KTR94524.1 fatty-acid--CoA ligase [Microbacterium testaceum]
MYPPAIARERPGHLAYVMAGSGDSLTYAALDDRSTRFSQALRAAGVTTGETLLIAMENRIEWPIAVAAGMRSGLYVTPVNSHLREHELAALVAEAHPAAVITSPALAPVVAAALSETAQRPRLMLCVGAGAEEFERFDDVLEAAPAVPIADETFGARVLYSGGSTGRPRAFRQRLLEVHPSEAPIRHGGLMSMLGLDGDSVFLSPAPAYHAAPFTFQLAALTAGATVICMERFDARGAMATILRHGVTLSQWVPTMLVRLLDAHAEAERSGETLPLSPRHRAAVTSGGPCAPEIKAAIDAWWGPILHEYYGASEGYGHTYISPLEARERVGSVGRALGETRVHIVDEAGREVPTGEIGTVAFEALGARTYANQGESAGWRHMGDLGTMDADGFVYLKGRAGYTIVSGGVNVYPDEVEHAVASHPWVRDVAVLGEPDPEFGERVLAVVELHESAPTDDAGTVEAAIIAHTRERVATFKAPKRVLIVDRLPRLPTGKLNKKALRDELVAQR